MVRLCFALLLLRKEQDSIHMPCRLMDDLEGKVIGEEVHEGGFENRLGTRPQGFESHTLRQNKQHLFYAGAVFYCNIWELFAPRCV